MYKNLIVRSAKVLVRIGRRILATLRVDPRMAETVTFFEGVQAALEATVNAWEAASEAATQAETERAKAYRTMSNTIREFGFTILAVTGNHHNVDPYLRYFPYGYGDARSLLPPQILEFTRLLLAKLDGEGDPKIAAGKGILTTALDSLERAEVALATATRTSSEAFGLMQSEKRNWTRGLARARALAESGCFYDHAYVRLLFEPAAATRSRDAVEEPEEGETPAVSTPPESEEDDEDAPSAPPAPPAPPA